MSRGGRGGGRGGRGGGRGGFGPGNAPPMGLTFADIQNLSRDAAEMYPRMDPLPVMAEYTSEEKKIAELQVGFITRLRQSPYYILENTKSDELPRYSDKYRTSTVQPPLKRSDFHKEFFPAEIYDDYFNPKKKRKVLKKSAKKLNLDELVDEEDEGDKSGDEGSNGGSEQESDYDVDEEYDNDYAENYFDNGEGDDLDDMVGGGDDGGGGDYD